MTRRRSTTRLVIALTCLASSLLLVFPAPAGILWLFAIVLEGHGAILAVVSLTPLWPGWRASRSGIVAAMIGVLAATISCTPAIRAMLQRDALEAAIDESFGQVDERVDQSRFTAARTSAFSLRDWLLGVENLEVRVDTYVYRREAELALHLDLYLPAEQEQLPPVIVVVHGGAWRGGERTELAFYDHWLTGNGYAVAAIDYRLAPKWQFPSQIDDIRAALDYLQTYGDRLGIDPQRVVLFGRSAGAQLALLAAYRLHRPEVRGVIALYPPVDLVWGWHHPSPRLVLDSTSVLEDFLGGPYPERSSTYLAASPHRFIGDQSPPTLIFHGRNDEMVSPRHSRLLAAELQREGVPHLLVDLPWAHHAFDLVAKSPGGQAVLYASERFLAFVLRP